MTIEERVSEIPQIPSIRYPIGAAIAAAVVRPLMEDIDLTWGEYASLQKQIIEPENPYAFEYLSGLAEGFSKDATEYYLSGIALAHNIFKGKAGGKLPVLTLKFVSDYQEKTANRINRVYGSANSPGAFREEEMRTTIFAILEKDVYQVLQEELVDEGQSIFDSPTMTGFINTYFLYREGFSDPKNWESLEVFNEQGSVI